MFIDNNGNTTFIDGEGNTLWIDNNGIFLGGGEGFRMFMLILV